MDEYFKISTAIITSLGGGAVLILAFSNFLGKVWANRLMESDKAKHSQELEEVRSRFQRDSQQSLAVLQSQIDVFKETQLREHGDKVVIYRATIDLVAIMMAKLEMTVFVGRDLSAEDKGQFQVDRLKIYGYLAMMAPQEVMDENDRFTDRLIEIVFEGDSAEWAELRTAALGLINAIRNDIGIDKTPITYNGRR
ncbi:hypothetical protein [Pseudoalteromonas rubra]|uniref:hypothetical protein n=1 Tax=Pseudoalteromonas rubra TaxID=43658 RepID=UPI000F7AC217|nr:hypothetical protein [Pseudoalteromonas rubra]